MLGVRRLRLVITIFVATVFLYSPTASAITQSELDSIRYNTPFYDQSCDSSSTVLTGSDSEHKALYYFASKGLGSIVNAAVVGNLAEESGLNPIVIQNPPGGTTHDPSTLTDPKVGWGIAQWTPGSKALNVKKSLNLTGPIDELATQLDMVWGQMTGTSPTNKQDMVQGLEQQTKLEDAVEYFRANFEGGDANPQRLVQAQAALKILQDSSIGSTSSCTVQCSTGTGTTLAGLSPTRQNVVCVAQQELAKWTNSYEKTPKPWLQFATYSDGVIGQGWIVDHGKKRYDAELWCADFVSWVYKQANYPFTDGQSGGWRLPAVAEIHDLGVKNLQFHWHSIHGYTPRPGDIAIYWNNDPDHPYYHTAIVEDVVISKTSDKTTTIKTIGGDQGTGDTTFGGPDSDSVVSEWSTHHIADFGDGGGFVSPDN